MIKLNKDTKQAKNWLNSEIQGYKLSDIYGRYSSSKANAFKYCEDLCEEKKGWGLCIISHNTFSFTVKFTTDAGVYIITKSNNYFIEL